MLLLSDPREYFFHIFRQMNPNDPFIDERLIFVDP
jgi:hypothetical protein